MHEYAIVRSLVDRVAREARSRHALRVRGVRVLVGELSGVEPGLLLTAFDACRAGTACDGATLDVVRVDVAWECSRCAAGVPPAGPRRCSVCGASARLARGDELTLERIELEVSDV